MQMEQVVQIGEGRGFQGRGQRLLDLLLTGVAFVAAVYAKMFLVGGLADVPRGAEYQLLFLATLFSCSVAYDLAGCYQPKRRRGFARTFVRLVAAVVIGAGGAVLISYLTVHTQFSRLLLGLFVGFDILFLLSSRAAARAYRSFQARAGIDQKEILVIGSRERARELIPYVRRNEEAGCHIIGCLEVDSDQVGAEVAEGVQVIGSLSDFRNLLLDRPVDEVIFAIPLLKIDDVGQYIHFAEEQGVNVRVLPDWQIQKLTYKPSVASVFIESFVGIPTLSMRSTPRKEIELMVKSILDRVLAAVGLLVLSPLFLLVGILIKISSPGPVLFRQARYGLNGRIFTLFKFRTMVVDAEKMREDLKAANEMDGPVFKIKEDPRVTGIGRLLRKTSFDELPQLINVLRGEMSLVGPRPPIPSEVKEYDHWQRRRLSMKPGLTCIWQVSGRNDVSFEEWMRMDLAYIDRWSLLLDVKLLLKTLPAVLLGTGR